ncbi:MAG TPA: DGQHR domain-containing protein [Candidatus Solibacter sp.]|nr:DGQHR domain-containing protein [Candidatus Solibacter sp.]
MSFPVIVTEQPAGTFYLTAMPASEVIRVARPNPRTYDPETLDSGGGIQREPSGRRIKAIVEYAESSDAAFPTAVLLAIRSEDCTLEGNMISISREGVADVVDGQHRILGLRESSAAKNFELPVIFIIDATDEEKALLFAIINGTQTKVPASLLYELYGVTESRSPAKTCHEIARSLNSMPESPWYRRLKMLGRKSAPGSAESLSQGTFAKFLMPLISPNPQKDRDLIRNNKPPGAYPQCIFNDYFREGKDSQILKVLLNVFQGARKVWPSEWDNPDDFVLTKTLGFSGIMRALPDMVSKGRTMKDLSVGYFSTIFARVKQRMDEKGIALKSDYFSASASGEAEFGAMIHEQVEETN